MRDIADVLKIKGRQDPKADILELFRIWLQDGKKGAWIMVLDSVDDASFLLELPNPARLERRRRLIDYLPACEHGHLLITSRSKSEARRLVLNSQMIHVPPMDDNQAQALLEQKLGVDDCAQYQKLAAALDHLPLAMAQAAAYIYERGPRCTVEHYLKKLEKSSKSRSKLLRRDERFPDREYDKASSSILITWQISFEHIAEQRQSATDLLALMSFCDRQAIPEILLRDQLRANLRDEVGSQNDGGTESDDDTGSEDVGGFEEDVTVLRNFSFISNTKDRSSWEMHRLVQDATRMWLEHYNRYENVQDLFLSRLDQALPDGKYENWTTCQLLFPHAETARGQKPARAEALSDWASVMHKAAEYAYKKGQLSTAETIATVSLQARAATLGEDHDLAIGSMGLLGLVVGDLGRLKEAEKLHLEAMEKRQATLGPDHLNTLVSMNDLASTYWKQGRFEEARKLQEEVMEKDQATLGPDHRSTLGDKNNLANTYSDLGRYKEGEKLHIEVMEKRLATLGPDHIDTLRAMVNLASTYWEQGRYKEAEKLQVEVMDRRQLTLGPDHPDTLTSMNNLASSYWKQDRWKEAEQLELKVHERIQETLGLDHPNTIASTTNLAATYWDQGRLEEAEVLLAKAVECERRVLGEDHPWTVCDGARLGTLRSEINDSDVNGTARPATADEEAHPAT